jgi:phenylacetate-CoA ligase
VHLPATIPPSAIRPTSPPIAEPLALPLVQPRFWNEAVETMAPADVRALEETRLAAQLTYNRAASPFLAAKLADAGLASADIRTRADLAAVPFMEKSELSESQRGGDLLGANRCAPLTDIVRIQATGGTTGVPLRIGLTRRDLETYNEMGARALWTMGCRPGDVVFTCMNFSLYAGGLSDHLTFETLGAATIPYGVGGTERLLRMMAAIGDPKAIWATPSYAVRLAEAAVDLGFEPRAVGLRAGYFSGEAGLQVPGYRARIEELWGMRARDQFGTGELGMHCGECDELDGLHYGATGFVLMELIDPDTGAALPFADGQVGEAVHTSIHRQACPLQRMRTHDLVQVFTEPCRCGRTTPRFRVLGRSDDMFIVKGVNVFPLAVQETVLELAPRLTGELRIVLDRPPPIDYPVPVEVEVARAVAAADHAALVTELVGRLARAHNFTADVRLVEQGSIATEGKTRRVVRTYRDASG